MNPGSEYEPPTHPYRRPVVPFEPPPPPRPPRRGWVLPVVAAVLVLLLGGGVAGAYLWYDRVLSSTREPAERPSASPGRNVTAATGLDVCAMVPAQEAERLAPGATVAANSRDNADSYTISFTCNWLNNRIPYGEYWRSREIDVRVEQHKGNGNKTGRAMAQNAFDLDYQGAKFRETAKPAPEKGEKEYISPTKEIEGVGDGAFAQYTWRRSGDLLWYSYGVAQARVGDMTIEVKFQAGQQRKDARIMSNQGTQSINEENAIREVTGLVTHVAKGVGDWKGRNPDVLAQPRGEVTKSPVAQPTPSATPLAAFPPLCRQVSGAATGLVPGGETRALGTEAGAGERFECRWLNRRIPLDGGGVKLRSAMVTVQLFANRAGGADHGAAKGAYAQKHGGNAEMSFGGIAWSEITDIEGLGDAAFSQYVAFKKGEVHNGAGAVVMRQGAKVITVDYAGVDVPEGATPNSAKARLLASGEARAGALALARAVSAALAKQPVGSGN